MKRNLLLILLLLATLGTNAMSTIRFHKLGVAEGLSHNTILDISQDIQGNMWFASINGLNRYDGSRVTQFYQNPDKGHSIASNEVLTSLHDSLTIWFGTKVGLSAYSITDESFDNFFYTEDSTNLEVSHIAKLDVDNLLLLTEDGVKVFNISSKSFTRRYVSETILNLHPNYISRCDNQIYIGTSSDIYIYNVEEQRLHKFASRSYPHINCILQDKDSTIWIASEGDGLFHYNIEGEEIAHYLKEESQLSSNFVRTIALDSNNRLWIGTYTALNIYDRENDTFDVHAHNPQEESSVSQNSVRYIFKDAQGGMWIGSYYGGVNYYHPLEKNFQHIHNIPNSNSLNDNVVSDITEDYQKNLWIGTAGGGLNYYNTKTKHFRNYTTADGLGSNDIKSILHDHERGYIYIATHAGGFNVLDTETNKITNYNMNNSPLMGNDIYSLIPSRAGDVLLGTLNSLFIYHPNNHRFQDIETDRIGNPLVWAYIRTLYRDSKERLWVGTDRGVKVMNEIDDTFLEENLLPETKARKIARVNCFHEDSNGAMWIGASNGLYMFNESDQQWKHYTDEKSGLHQSISGILEDNIGNLWISTERGLISLALSTNQTRIYTSLDGLQSNLFTPYSYLRTEDGIMYFGGINGINYFNPEKFANNPFAPPPIITSLYVANKQVLPNDETKILSRHISLTSQITLQSEQMPIQLHFSVPNYIGGNNNKFAYQLEGYDEEWYTIDRQSHHASYNKLPDGRYTFKVKAMNNDGEWSNKYAEIEIDVLPPWYSTWWANLLYILVICAIATTLYHFYSERNAIQHKLEKEHTEKEQQFELNEMKTRFFINLSHELRTPLTLILNPIQEMLAKADDPWMRQQLTYVNKNTLRLLHIVNQLLEYRKAELGVFNLKVSSVDINSLVEKIFLYYEKIAQRKHINYQLYPSLTCTEFTCDSNYVELILNNLLSNAFKFTSEGGSIFVFLREENNQLIIEVKDTGIGIKPEDHKKIFERFYQANKLNGGSGIGLSLIQRLVDLHHGEIELQSAVGEGSSFIVKLPLSPDCYTQEERLETVEENNLNDNSLPDRSEQYALDTDPIMVEDAIEEHVIRAERSDNILIVEDNPEILQFLGNELAHSYNVFQAKNGVEALDILQQQNINLVLTDMMMPLMDGTTLCKHIKSSLKYSHIFVIILSAKGEMKDQMEALSAGADDYIVKPFIMPMLMVKVRNLLRTAYLSTQHHDKSTEITVDKIALNQADETFLSNAMAIVEKNLDNAKFSTTEFCKELCLSRSTLHIKMKKITGETPNDFIRRIRLNHACKLIKEGKYSIAEVSYMAGFNSASYFATCFKKTFDCLPSEYVKR